MKKILTDADVTGDILSLNEVCGILSVTKATAKNWIRLGKLVPDRGTGYSRKYISDLYSRIADGDSVLKSRRNKNRIVGNMLYGDYIKSAVNKNAVRSILSDFSDITCDELCAVLSGFARQLYTKSREYTVGSDARDDVLASLADELFGNADISPRVAEILNRELTYVPYEDTLGFIYISLRDMGERKQTGAYYTPADTVLTLIDGLCKACDIRGKSICDPCCGTGNFLLGLLKKGVEPSYLYGADTDRVSVLITKINVFIENPRLSREALDRRIVCKNTLTDEDNTKFDIVLGNPPWGYDFSEGEMSRLSVRYVTARSKNVESYDVFTEKALSMLNEKGLLAFILPEAFLGVASHAEARKLLISKCAFRFVDYLGNAFSNVLCPSVILGVSLDAYPKTVGCKVTTPEKDFVIGKERMPGGTALLLNITDKEADCIEMISSTCDAVYLENNAKFALGIVTGDNRSFIESEKRDGLEPILRGSDIGRYSVGTAKNYIEFVPERFQQVAPTEFYRAPEKLLYRFVCDIPVFAYDNSQTLTLNSCNILIPEIAGMNIKYLLAVLNSSVASFYLSKKFNSLKMLRSHLEKLPIPFPSAGIQAEIAAKADLLIGSSDKFADIYREIDNDIMELYRLPREARETINSALLEKRQISADILTKI